MSTSNPRDPLAAIKKSSPGDPIIPEFEYINSELEAVKGHAKSIERDAASLVRTRRWIFLLGCLLSAALASAVTWYEIRGNPSPDIQILRNAGIEVRVTDANEEVRIAFLGDKRVTPSITQPTATTKRGLVLTWSKQ